MVKLRLQSGIEITKRELNEIYNALCCLNIEIRDKPKQKRRTKFIQKLIKKVSAIK